MLIPTEAEWVAILKKCEGCGMVNRSENYKHIHLTNGGLILCLQCLAELNGKNPELKTMKAELDAALETIRQMRAG